MQDMARTLRYLFLLLFVTVAGTAFAQSGAITGTVLDEKKEPMIGAVVQVFEGGLNKGGAATDIDGNYTVKPLSPGRYEVRISFTSYKTSVTQGVLVSPDKTTQVNASLEVNTKEMDEFVIVDYKVPLIDKYAPGSVTTLTSETIDKMPTRSTNAMAATTAGVYQGNDGALNIQGGRDNQTVYYIDGVQVRGQGGINLPQGMIDQMQVMTSGLSARYGDAVGGVIAITTRGISDKYRGGITLEHSVDGYNHNLASANVSGPLYSKKTDGVKKAKIGFLVGGDFWYDEDRRPSYYGNYALKEGVLDRLQARPLRPQITSSGTPAFRPSSEFVRQEDITTQKKRENAAVMEARINGKLDFELAENLNLTAGGNFGYTDRSLYSRNASLFAPDAQLHRIDYTGRGYLRLTQRFGKSNLNPTGEENVKTPLVSNAFYTLQADYQRDFIKQEHPDHKENIFNYGYVGKFNTFTTSLYAPGIDDSTGLLGVKLLADNVQVGTVYERSELNPILANYTSQYYESFGIPRVLTDITQSGSLVNGFTPPTAYQRWQNVGYTYNANIKQQQDQFSVGIDASFDFQPAKTRHAIEFGLYYQQRIERFYSVIGASATGGLWQYMRQLSNRHIALSGDPVFIVNGQRYTRAQVESGMVSPSPFDTIVYDRVATLSQQSTFDRSLRSKLGLNPNGTDYINIDNYDPSMYSLDMFSATELLNSGNPYVNYRGYDYTGKKQKGQVNFNDFFTKRDADGNYTRDIGAFRPNYIAGYVLDRFQFKDILFNVGVRVDRYDANTKVLKDPYSLYAVKTAKDARAEGLETPSSVGDDYVVYVNNNDRNSKKIIVGYRSGDTWFDNTGKEINDPTVLAAEGGGQALQPYLVDPERNITDSLYDPNSSFTDYKPQVNVMPRVSFSFPISDEALFYAHYDVVVQRPYAFNTATAADYFYLANNNQNLIDNPDLKSEKKFDYEVGFQQQLTQHSAVTLNAFYKERKDMIQIRPYLFAWPQTYFTYGNRDFSTTKGFSLKYDLRRVGNIQMNIAYTLQFAEGTGSDATSANGNSGSNGVSGNGLLANLIAARQPNLRMVMPLDYDSRHMISAVIDYRYKENEGPVVGGNHILQNAGLNLIANARSGEPYTRYYEPLNISRRVQGAINGSRLPWHYGLDLRVDKDFKLAFGKKDAEAGKQKSPLYLNAFVLINNLLNTREILSVDGYTGSWDDDGYLAHPTGIQQSNIQTDPVAYRYLYQISVEDPGRLNLPRRINVGLSLNF